MPGTEVLVQIVLGLAAIGGAIWVLRWAWNSRKAEGTTEERSEALERAVLDSAERDEKTREERSQSHDQWKSEGAKRRRSRENLGKLRRSRRPKS